MAFHSHSSTFTKNDAAISKKIRFPPCDSGGDFQLSLQQVLQKTDAEDLLWIDFTEAKLQSEDPLAGSKFSRPKDVWVVGTQIYICIKYIKSPRKMGRWSNLTSIFFKGVGEKPPTRCGEKRDEGRSFQGLEVWMCNDEWLYLREKNWVEKMDVQWYIDNN